MGHMPLSARPGASEYAPYFSGYVGLVPEADVLTVLEDQLNEVPRLGEQIPADRETFRYAEGKWSIREVFGHLIDAERVFGYRAFCISRGEIAPLPSFDENIYVQQSGYVERPLGDLIREFNFVRSGNLGFLRCLDDQAWGRIGTASNKPISVLALAFIMGGHVRHHFNILRARYDVSQAR
jgi:DinB superfamily